MRFTIDAYLDTLEVYVLCQKVHRRKHPEKKNWATQNFIGINFAKIEIN